MKKLLYILSLLIITSFSSCYTFSGASIAADVKTVTIAFFPTYAANANPNLSQLFTQALQDKFNSLTNLQQVTKDGDLNFEGEITSYTVNPQNIQADETAASNRLTVYVTVRFTNTKDESQNFDTSFSAFADFEASENLINVEEGLIKKINDQLTQDIFNKSVTNW